jgi:hypothetical protein
MLGSGQALGVLEQAMRAALTCAGVRDKTITTVLGPVTLHRAWYHCAGCKHGFAPRDRQLGVADATESPGLFERAAHRMHYAKFQKLGMLIGSGAIEGGIKAIVVQRATQAGMHWTVEGAENIIHLRCQRASGRWDEMWPARPDPLQLAV